MKTTLPYASPISSRTTKVLQSVALLAVATLSLSACVSDSTDNGAPRRMFATSQAYTGNFGGVVAADSICNTLATAALLGGKWKSFLSDSAAGALDRQKEVGPWFRVETTGERTTKVFNNRTGFTVGALAAINNEYGTALPTNVRVWTGTGPDGGAAGSETCAGWKSTAAFGTDGNPNSLLANGPKWMYSAEGAAQCSQTKRLYCFEQ